MSTNTHHDVAAALAAVRERIAAAAKRAGRAASDITLVAVTKYAHIDQIRQLIDLGHRDLAENRVQNLQQRAADLPGDVRWHMIGHLQRNKVKAVLPLVSMVHSVDSLRLAQAIDERAMTDQRSVDVLLQVNVSGEESKFGVEPDVAVPLAGQLCGMEHLRLRGLMTMAPYSDNAEDARPTFAGCRRLFELIRDQMRGMDAAAHFDVLSMGMTGDFEVALEEGATLVRIGSALFGEA